MPGQKRTEGREGQKKEFSSALRGEGGQGRGNSELSVEGRAGTHESDEAGGGDGMCLPADRNTFKSTES